MHESIACQSLDDKQLTSGEAHIFCVMFMCLRPLVLKSSCSILMVPHFSHHHAASITQLYALGASQQDSAAASGSLLGSGSQSLKKGHHAIAIYEPRVLSELLGLRECHFCCSVCEAGESCKRCTYKCMLVAVDGKFCNGCFLWSDMLSC